MRISPDGATTATICSGKLIIIDNQTGEKKYELSSDSSALSEVEYIDETTICFAGTDGLSVVDITNQKVVWTGEKATGIAVSADKTRIAGIYKDDKYATLYNSKTGKVIGKVSFNNKCQSVTVNDTFANPNDNLFELNEDGTELSVSFSDGSLMIYDLDKSDDIELFDNTSGYKHFEGGFYSSYFAFSASNNTDSVFAVIDTNTKEQLGGFDKEGYFEVKANETGIYLKTDNLLVKLEPDTGEQTPLATTAENLNDFSHSYGNTIASYKDGVIFFNDKAQLTSKVNKKFSCDFVNISKGIAVVGSRDEPDIYIFKYDNHSESQLFSYDSKVKHDEARVSLDYKTLMLFDYKQFRIYDVSGEMICKKDIPNPSDVYDQQYRRKDGKSFLEVIYNDGTVIKYNATDGREISSENGSKPDATLYEEFNTSKYRIESPLHGTPKVYDKASNQLIKELEEDAYLTYVTEVGNYIITQYVTASSEYYGYLLNQDCEVIGTLPYLCDVINGNLIFDYPTGDIRKSKIYSIQELVEMAQQKRMEEQ